MLFRTDFYVLLSRMFLADMLLLKALVEKACYHHRREFLEEIYFSRGVLWRGLLLSKLCTEEICCYSGRFREDMLLPMALVENSPVIVSGVFRFVYFLEVAETLQVCPIPPPPNTEAPRTRLVC